jgi:polysaccharide pyruvyl transferase WcaK-like protein
MRSNMIVAVHGSYFNDNFGDTLLVKIMCDWIAAIVGRENVYLAVNGNVSEQACIGYPVLPEKLRSNVTHLIYGGGGYFGERSSKLLDNLSWTLRNYSRHLKWGKTFKNANIAIIGVGFGPISNYFLRKSIKNLISKSKLTLFRDQESFIAAKNYGIESDRIGVCVDIALSLSGKKCNRSGVAIHVDNFNSNEIYLIFSTLFQHFGSQNRYHILYDNSDSFSSASRKMYEDCASRAGIVIEIHPYTNYINMLNVVESYSLIITSKLHVGIAAIAKGGRVISIPSHQKTIRLYKQLKIHNFCINRENLTQEALIDRINQLEHYDPDRTVIDEGVKKIKNELANFLVSKSS